MKKKYFECICSGSIKTQHILLIKLFNAIYSLFGPRHTFESETPAHEEFAIMFQDYFQIE